MGTVCFIKICRFSSVPEDLRIVRERIKERRGINLTNKSSIVFTAAHLKWSLYTAEPLNFFYIFPTMESLSRVWTDSILSLMCFGKV